MNQKTIQLGLFSAGVLCLFGQQAQAQNISIGDRVWHDLNRNGRQDSGEPGISGVTVKLYADANGDNVADNATATATAVTNANGNYSFNNVTPGKYFVQFPVPVPQGYSGYTTQSAAGVPADQWSSCNVNTGKTGTHQFTSNYFYKDAGLLKNIGISGKVYDDNNAGTPDGTVLPNVNVSLKSGATTVATAVTDANGNYSFAQLIPGNYKVVITPGGGYSVVSATDGSPTDGSTDVSLGNNNSVTGINFGLNLKPTAVNDNLNNQTPGTAATVSNILANDTDPNNGTLSKDSISLIAPSGATGITTDPHGDITGFTVANQGSWALNSSNGAVTFTPLPGFTSDPTPIKYTVTDNARLTSNEATITIDYYTTVSISGEVHNDPNGGNINGPLTNGGGTLHAILINNAGNVVLSLPVNASGQYTFAAVMPGNYKIRLSTTAGNAGQQAPAASLPLNWVNTAEGLTAAGDGTPDGNINITVGTAAITNANFGIQAAPKPKYITNAIQLNPGGTANVNVPANLFGGSDLDGGKVVALRITAFPTGATSTTINNITYTPANFPTSTGVTVPTDTLGQPTQSITVDPAQNGTTTISILYKVKDDAGTESSTTGTATLPFKNTTQAVNDINNTIVNTAVTGNVLTNDEDYEGNQQTVNPNTVSPPAHGTVTLNSNGTYTYTPAANFIGEDQFRYSVCDNDSSPACDTAVVNIRVLPRLVGGNNPPTANDDAATTAINTAVSGNMIANDLDPDANPLSINTTPVLPPANGTLTINSNGTYTYTPANNFTGKDSFDYRVCDNGTPALCSVATVFIDVLPLSANNITYANDDAGTGKQNMPISGNVSTNDTDPQGNTQTVTITPVTGPAHGSVVLNANGNYIYTPNNGYIGPDKFVYTTCDNGTPAACDQATVYLTVQAPPAPDLTPVIQLPVNAMNTGDSRDFVVRLNEIHNITTNGLVAFNISVPVGYTLSFNGAITNINVLTAGTFTVSNNQWNTFNVTSRSIDLQAKPGFVINNKGNTYLGFKVTRVSALSNSVSNITVNIYPDTNRQYDSNNANNLYNRVITAN